MLGRFRPLPALAVVLLSATVALAETLVVAPSGTAFNSIQAALDAAQAGDTVLVREGVPYHERLVFPRGGSIAGGFLTLAAWPGEHPVLDGIGAAGGPDMILLEDLSFVRIEGLRIRNALGVSDGSGIRVLGAGSHIEILNNEIHDIRGTSAMGITVYATRAQSISDLVISGNLVHDCEPAPSEAITLNGNVDGFKVIDNLVRDVDNIGIDMIGGETDIQPDANKVARNGLVQGNRVERARSSYGGGYAAGIYVDGGRDIVIEGNVVTESDLGIEIGAENAGRTTQRIAVRSNLLYRNDKAGLIFGGYDASVGRVSNCEFRNNTLWGNDTLGRDQGQVWIQWASDNVFSNNIVMATTGGPLLVSWEGNSANTLDWNFWFGPAGGAGHAFIWNDNEHENFAAYRGATGQESHSTFVDPLLTDAAAGDFHLSLASPAVNAGDPATVVVPSEKDIDGAPRLSGPRIDVGADEVGCGDGVKSTGEACDDGNGVSGDGCDVNCTPTGCGNGIVTSGETCDDGNQATQDCCGASCEAEPDGTICDDGDLCSREDVCSAAACAGSVTPFAENACRQAASIQLVIKQSTNDLRDSLSFRWTGGAATTLADLGDPASAATRFSLCVFDEQAAAVSLVARVDVPAGGSCAGKPCWTASTSGLRFRDAVGSNDGTQRIVLKAGATGRASAQLLAKGSRLGVPLLPLAQDPVVTAQLRSSSGLCLGARFESPSQRNDAAVFQSATP